MKSKYKHGNDESIKEFNQIYFGTDQPALSSPYPDGFGPYYVFSTEVYKMDDIDEQRFEYNSKKRRSMNKQKYKQITKAKVIVKAKNGEDMFKKFPDIIEFYKKKISSNLDINAAFQCFLCCQGIDRLQQKDMKKLFTKLKPKLKKIKK